MTFLRAACSALILLPGTRSTNSGAAAILGHATDRGGITHILQRLSDSPCGEQVIAAVTRLADYLTVSQVPIDYQRRRTLDYAGILPRAEWDQICRVSAARPGRENKVHIARAYLSHRLSSLPCGSPPAGLAVTPYDFRTYVAQFPAQLTPELDAQLEAAGRRFLAACGINGEPLTWQPPLDLIHDLELPGPDPDSISLDDLHRLIRGGKSPAMAARHLGTTTDAVRVVLAEHPAPARAARGKERTLRET
jgi:hypothetical protein